MRKIVTNLRLAHEMQVEFATIHGERQRRARLLLDILRSGDQPSS